MVQFCAANHSYLPCGAYALAPTGQQRETGRCLQNYSTAQSECCGAANYIAGSNFSGRSTGSGCEYCSFKDEGPFVCCTSGGIFPI